MSKKIKETRKAKDAAGNEVEITIRKYNAELVHQALESAAPAFHEPRGNRKTGGIDAWNIVPGETCSKPACATCYKEGCYALKNMLMAGYNPEKNNVLKAWTENTRLAMDNIPALERQLDAYLNIKELSISSAKFFRIHSAGDFFSIEYAEMWLRLAAKHPGIKFLAFTKQFDIVRNVPFYTLENFSLVLSGWTGCKVPEDLREYYHMAHCVEPGAAVPDGALECPGHCDTCGMCWNLRQIGKDTYFHKH